ncbi:MAG: hypothetical protein JNM10_09345 [Planctomycetia bacterium]|nr:hypothetical protein [Planctomycetia bacterium]
MRTTTLRVVSALLVAGTVAGCCRRCPPCSPSTVASGAVPGHPELPDATRQAVVRRLRVGMTIDEVRAVLRPFADSELGGLGRFGWTSFRLRDGELLLHFDSGSRGQTFFRDDPGDGSFTDQVPPFILMGDDVTFRLVAGGDFNPPAGG